MNTPLHRIGVFGGTFNPIHNCHLTIARQARQRLKLDLILFIPTGDPPHKAQESLAPARHRLEMVRLAVASDPGFSCSELEARRAGKSYSIDTIHLLRTEYPKAELFFIIGLDAFLEVAGWKQAEELIKHTHFVVVSRPGMHFSDLSRMPLLPSTDPTLLAAFDNGPIDRLDIPLTSVTALILFRLPPCPISASEIRLCLRNGQSVANWLPDSVESYILCHELYREDADRSGSKS